jgi:hypothetical protein
MKPWIDIMQVASLQAELAMVQAQLADRHAAATAHLHQQQNQQMGAGLSSSAAAGQAAYMQQFEQQSDQLNIPPTSPLSMSLASGSGSPTAAHNYLRIKEEGRRPYHAGMQHDFRYGMPSNVPLEPGLSHQALVQQAESLEKPRTGTLSDQPDDGELQALAHSLLRRSK